MRKVLLLLVMVFAVAMLWAQTPQKMTYQAVVRNANNSLVVNQNVRVRISILQGSESGSPVYVETHEPSTNANGLMTVEVGDGSVVSGVFTDINWANGPYYLKSEIDPTGGFNYNITGVQELLSVPYALYASQAGNVPAFAVIPTDTGYVISITQAGSTPQAFFLRQGTPGPQGPQGEPGNNGADGNGIASIAKTGEVGNVDTYTITFTNGSTSTFTVTNGVNGTNGQNGQNGQDGVSPIVTTLTAGDSTTVTITDANGPHSFVLHNGQNGVDGADGINGTNGTNGQDGFSPIVTTITAGDSTTVTITDANGPHSFVLRNGQNGINGTSGTNGQDGFSPIVMTTTAGDSTTVTITDANGPHSFVLHNGQNGVDGADGINGTNGTNGQDGFSPIVTTFTAGDSTTVTITDANGSHSFVLHNGQNGVDGADGINGTNGQDGFSPIVTTTTAGDSTTVTITDANGPHSFVLHNGQNGVDGVDGINGTNGTNGIDGNGIVYIVKTGADYLVDTYTITYTNGSTSTFTVTNGAPGAQGPQGDPGTSGSNGNDGRGIVSIAKTGETGNVDTYTITYTDATTSTFTITNGEDGEDGVSPIVTAAASGSNVIITVTDGTGSHEYVIPTTSGEMTQLPANWTEENSSSPQYIMNKPTLAPVATSGSYNDLSNKPEFPAVPTEVSAFNNDAGYLTSDSLADLNNQQVQMQHLIDSLSQVIDDLQFVCGAEVQDVDGNIYHTVKIGNQCWMRENMKTTRFSDGTAIQQGAGVSSVNAYWYYPNGNSANKEAYGLLYNWPAVMNSAASSDANPSGVQGLCPKGWHVPSTAEWTQLTEYVGGQSQYLCNSISNNIAKSLAATTAWINHANECAVGNDVSANNATGFSAMPSGAYYSGNMDFNRGSYFYCATESNAGSAYVYTISHSEATVSNYAFNKIGGFSVRCMRSAASQVSIPSSEINLHDSLATVAFTGNYEDMTGTPEIPTVPTVISAFTNDAGYITNDSIPTNLSAFTNDANYITMDSVSAYVNDATLTIQQNGSELGTFTANQSANQTVNITTLTIDDVQAMINSSLGTVRHRIDSMQNALDDVYFVCGTSMVKDYDGNQYATVKIGSQCWLKENLRSTHYSNGAEVTNYYHANDDEGNDETYGLLYNWNTTVNGAAASDANPSGVQGICPTGWHVPSHAEWTQMMNYVKSQSMYHCDADPDKIGKALAATTGWDWSGSACRVGNDLSSNNASGFSALPAGRYLNQVYNSFGEGAMFWTSSLESSPSRRRMFTILYNQADVQNDEGTPYTNCFSVRCVRDNSSMLDQLEGRFEEQQHLTDSLQDALNDVAFVCGYSKLKDYDGNRYATVKIGVQCWMKENIRSTHYSDGTEVGDYSHVNGSSSNDATLGLLYSWSVALNGGNFSNTNPSGVQGICPTGWHVPSKAEWEQLKNYLGSHSQFVCGGNITKIAKALADTIGWNESEDACDAGNDQGSNNATGFTAHSTNGTYADFWSSTSYSEDAVYEYYLSAYDERLMYGGSGASNYSVRCVKDQLSVDDRLMDLQDQLDSLNNYMTEQLDSLNNSMNNQLDSLNNQLTEQQELLDLMLPCYMVPSSGSKTLIIPEVTHVDVYDKGGPNGDYLDNWNGSLTLVSRPNSMFKITGTYATELNYDYLYIYNGATVQDNNLIISYSGAGSISEAIYTTGDTVTIRFRSDGGITGAGFSLSIDVVEKSCGGSVKATDVQGNRYSTVAIGEQCWLQENLRSTKYANGEQVTLGAGEGYRCFYPNNDAGNVATYGYLYNRAAVMHGSVSSSANPSGVRGLCPAGWHVPSDVEWTQLTDYVRNQSGFLCNSDENNIAKALSSATGWASSPAECNVGNDMGSNNVTGFNALPAGSYSSSASEFGQYANFWTATESNVSDYAKLRYIYNADSEVSNFEEDKGYAYSVRCVRD
ncbi:MAG: hypothetical protein IKO62_02560 [Bacteroidales bacterium]|nr:hypothetical protein [Bacteroidales bacterium]